MSRNSEGITTDPLFGRLCLALTSGVFGALAIAVFCLVWKYPTNFTIWLILFESLMFIVALACIYFFFKALFARERNRMGGGGRGMDLSGAYGGGLEGSILLVIFLILFCSGVYLVAYILTGIIRYFFPRPKYQIKL